MRTATEHTHEVDQRVVSSPAELMWHLLKDHGYVTLTDTALVHPSQLAIDHAELHKNATSA